MSRAVLKLFIYKVGILKMCTVSMAAMVAKFYFTEAEIRIWKLAHSKQTDKHLPALQLKSALWCLSACFGGQFLVH